MHQHDPTTADVTTQATNLRLEARSWVQHILRVYTLHSQHDHLRADQELLAVDSKLWRLAESDPRLCSEFIAGAAEEFDRLVELGRDCRSAVEAHAPAFNRPRLLVLPASGSQARGRTWFLNNVHALEAVMRNDEPAAAERIATSATLVAELGSLDDATRDEEFITGAAKQAEEYVGEMRATCHVHPVRLGWWTDRCSAPA